MTDADCESDPKQSSGVQPTQQTSSSNQDKPRVEQQQSIEGKNQPELEQRQSSGAGSLTQEQTQNQQDQQQGQDQQAQGQQGNNQNTEPAEPKTYKCVSNKCQRVVTAVPTIFGSPFTNPARESNQRCTLDRQCPPGFKCSWLRGGRCHAD
ncbi:hypothetical protein M1146_04585 [Patescibacteria group bacterium]|nr:hypothetical protein [Patescibacteria group bacterium]